MASNPQRIRDRSEESYALKALRPIWRVIRWPFVWADAHNGFITALATIAIVLLTRYYVRYSGLQWTEMNKQTAIALQQLGDPAVQLSQSMVVHYDKETKSPSTVNVS